MSSYENSGTTGSSKIDNAVHMSAWLLPDDVRAMAGLRSPVVQWTALDPALANSVDSYVCCTSFGPVLAMPCFWPHLLIIWPCLLASQLSSSSAIKNEYWILTEAELKVVNKNHDESCIPGCCQSSNDVKTIPLENITDCGVDAAGTTCGMTPLPTIHVDTASSGSGRHEATGVALADYNAFIQAILNQRDIVKGISSNNNASNVVTATAVTHVDETERGSGVGDGGVSGQQQQQQQQQPTLSVAERIEAITKLFNDGVLTQAEYDKKRQEIIDSI